MCLEEEIVSDDFKCQASGREGVVDQIPTEERSGATCPRIPSDRATAAPSRRVIWTSPRKDETVTRTIGIVRPGGFIAEDDSPTPFLSNDFHQASDSVIFPLEANF